MEEKKTNTPSEENLENTELVPDIEVVATDPKETEVEENTTEVKETVTEEVKTEEATETPKTEDTNSVEVVAENNQETTPATQDKAFIDGEYNPNARSQRNLAEQVTYDPLVAENLNPDLTISQMMTIEKDTFSNHYKKFNMFRIAVFIVVAVAIVGVIITIFLANKDELQWVLWTVISIAIVILLACVFVNRYFRIKITKQINDYLSKWAITMASNVYATHPDVKDAKIAINGNVEDKDVFNAHYYSVIRDITSRFRIEAKYLDRDYSDCETSIMTNADVEVIGGINPNKEVTENAEGETAVAAPEAKPVNKVNKNARINALFGKFISYDLKLNNNEGIIICFTAPDFYLPTNLKNHFEVSIEGLPEYIKVYTTDEEFANKLLNENVKATLNAIVPDNVFTGGFISMNSHGTKIGLNFSDDIMRLPIDSVPSEESLTTYKRIVYAVLDFLKVVQQ